MANTWDTTTTTMPTGEFFATSAVVSGKIYVIGGNVAPFNQVQIYDPVANSWNTTTTTMPVGVYWVTSAVVSGKIYVFGGITDQYPHGATRDVQIYDPVSNSWTTETSTSGKAMPAGEYRATSAVVRGKIYTIGGDANSTINQIYTPPLDLYYYTVN